MAIYVIKTLNPVKEVKIEANDIYIKGNNDVLCLTSDSSGNKITVASFSKWHSIICEDNKK